MSKRNNIILIGFMGSGKTTFGKWIAANKKMEFVDTDELIEKENEEIVCEVRRLFCITSINVNFFYRSSLCF